MRRHTESRGLDVIAIQPSEEFARLLFHLLLLLGDVGNDIAEDVERSYSRVSSAADGLHRSHEDRLDAELLMQRCKGHNQTDGRAVGIGDDVATRLLAPALLLDE